MGLPNGAEWLILVLIVVLLFGAKKLPEAARGVGRSLRIFKAEVKQTEPTAEDYADATPPAAIAPPGAVAIPPTVTPPVVATAPVVDPAAPTPVTPAHVIPAAGSTPVTDPARTDR